MSIWENERYYSLAGWFPPPRFERPRFVDGDGQAVEFETGDHPNLNPAQWTFKVSPHTDSEGWQYSTSFSHIEEPRDGGRASKRATDCVRCREWMEAGDKYPEQPQASQSQRRSLTVYRGLSAFIGILNEVLQRRRIWEVLPWDPGAWLVVYGEHQEYFRALLSLEAAFSQSSIRLNSASHETLQEMQSAARHARAAYGYVMWAGHMESIDKVLMLHTIHNKFFDPVAGASIHANTKAVCTLADINEEDVLMIDWSNSQYRPCHYVAVDREIQRVMLVIRGSSETGDLITDITGQPLTVSLCGKTGKVHSGAMSAATYIQCQTRETLEKAANLFPGWPLLITGHSLGGGVAAILTLLLLEEDFKFPRIYSIGIGSASVMSEELAEQCSSSVTTVVRRGDVVPRLSCHSVEALLLELSKSSPAKRAVTGIFHSASSALRSVKDKIFQASPQSQELAAVERSPSSSKGLKCLHSFLKDEHAIGRAVQAARHALVNCQEKELLHSQPRPGRKSPEPTATREWSNEDVVENPKKDLPNQGVFPGESGSFTPMYPAGHVFWILPAAPQEQPEEQAAEADWWKKLQEWGRDTLEKSKSIARKSGSPLSQGSDEPVERTSRDCASLLGKSMIRDLEWIDMWFKNQAAEDGKELNDVAASRETSTQIASNAPETNQQMARADSSTDKRKTEPASSQRKMMLLVAERKSFGRILLHPDMMSDHLPIGYLTAIRSLANH